MPSHYDMTEDELADELKECLDAVDDYLEATEDHRVRADQCEDYRHGIQWTDEERKILARRNEPCLTFNMIAGKVGAMLGAEVIGRTDPKARGRNVGGDEESADTATAAIRFVCDENNWPQERSWCRADYYVRGTMAAAVDVEEDSYQSGNPKITARHIPWDRSFYDPHSRYLDFRDANYMGEYVWKDLADAKLEYEGNQTALDSLENAESMEPSSTTTDETLDDRPRHWISGHHRKRVRIGTRWYKKGGEWWVAEFCAGGFLENPRISPYVTPDGRTEPGMAMRSAYIRKENERYGIVEGLLSAQDEVNKRRSKALHLMNTKLVIADEGAVEDPEQARQEVHKASGYVRKKRGYDFVIADHQQQVVDNLQLMQEAKGQFETLGPSESLIGQAAPDASGIAIERRQRAALLKYGDVLDGARFFELDVYKLIWHRIVQFWSEEDYIRVTDDPQAPQYLGINVRVPVTVADMLIERGVPPEQLQAAIQNGLIPPEQMAQVLGERVENNLAELNVDIILDTGPDYATLREEQLANLMSLVGQVGQSLSPQVLQVVLEMIVELSPLESRLKKRFFEVMRPSPEQQQAEAQKQAQLDAIQQQSILAQFQKLMADVAKTQAETELTKAKTETEEAKADKTMAEAASTAHDIGAPAASPGAKS